MPPLQKRSGNTLYHTYRNHDTCMLISDASCPAELALEKSLQPAQTRHGGTWRTVQRKAQEGESRPPGQTLECSPHLQLAAAYKAASPWTCIFWSKLCNS